jgi:hypothetical protein
MKHSLMCTLTAAVALLLSGCGNEKKSTASEDKKTPAPAPVKAETKGEAKADEKKPDAPKADTKPADAGEAVPYTFGKDTKRTVSIPKNWKPEEPSSGMRVGQIRVPKTGNDTEDGDIAISRMKGAGGIDGNIPRWVGQMGGGDALKKQRKLKTASGEEASIAELEGTYTSMTAAGTGEPKSGYKMLGAVIIAADGEYYFKFAGPNDTVEAARAGFDKMIESFK